MPETPGSARGSSGPDRSHTLRDWAHLYEAADELTARCQTGEAAAVLDEIGGLLAEAEAADVPEVLYRLRYVVALASLYLRRTDDTIAACDEMIGQGEAGDPVWTSSAYALRAIARSATGDHLSAVDDLVDATVLLDDARPAGQPYVYAVDGIGVGCFALRLYELALETYPRAAALVARPGQNLPRTFHLFHKMWVEIFWGLELERLDRSDEASGHFQAALAMAGDAEPLPALGTNAWALRMRALAGLCEAMTGDPEQAAGRLEATVAALAEHPVAEEALARIGLVRVYSRLGDADRALAEATLAEEAAARTAYPQLGLVIAWERQRLERAAGTSTAATVVIEYANRLERERWDDRVRFAAETKERLEFEIERRSARRMSAEYLTDGLTGAANRRHLELRLPEMVGRARTHDEAVALAFVDLDLDTSTDDLVSIGAELRSGAGPDGFVARYGGTEFVVVLPRRTARQLADVVDDVIGGRRTDGAPRPPVGVASARRPESVAGLVAAADEALLAARRAGGGIQLAVS